MDISRDEEICLRELDHLQAMVGRYDSYFFWTKNICLVTLGGGLALRASAHLVLWPLVVLPSLFFLAETFFRRAYWSPKIARIKEIARHLNGDSIPDFRLYGLEKAEGYQRSVKPYDALFYGVAAVVMLLLAIMDCKGCLFAVPT